MKNQIALPANQAKQSRISLWLNRENVLFSSIMEEKISNRQAVFRIHPLAGRHCLPLLVCLFHLTLQERRFIMDDNVEKAVFRVQKTSYYNKNGLFIEEFQICMNGCDSIMCQREEFEDLYKIMGIALNDRKEETNGRGSRI